MISKETTCISEIFSSIQGEGPFVGTRQIFVRFAHCNLDCEFCDEKSRKKARYLSVDELAKEIFDLDKGKMHHSVSLTGGEPLMHVPYLEELLPILRSRKLKIYLETNGTLPESLKKVMDKIDIIAMDIKLPSSTKREPCWSEHKQFLETARGRNLFVKVIITTETTKKDIDKAVAMVRKVDRDILMVLQPATPISPRQKEVPVSVLLDYLFRAEKKLGNVRIIPQVHKLMKVR
ncbi:MAG: 7-carboxy-7-deazaguanine synthase QueE [Candidatus Omnitrophica bacterium]|nr:7-carboxy-7-deazaguanine synthase QueE [Candidatus Omnitrophota bacterium]